MASIQTINPSSPSPPVLSSTLFLPQPSTQIISISATPSASSFYAVPTAVGPPFSYNDRGSNNNALSIALGILIPLVLILSTALIWILIAQRRRRYQNGHQGCQATNMTRCACGHASARGGESEAEAGVGAEFAAMNALQMAYSEKEKSRIEDMQPRRSASPPPTYK